MIDATALGPVTLHASNLQVGVTRHEEEVVIHKLLTNTLIHSSEGIVLASQVTLQPLKSSRHQLLNTNTLLLGDARRQAKSLDGAANTDPDRVNRHLRVDIALHLAGVHVRDMLESSRKSVVLADQGIEDISEVNVGVLITSIDTTVLVVKLNSASNGLGKGESGGLGLDPAEPVPLVLGHMLGNQAVGGLNVGELLIPKMEIVTTIVFNPIMKKSINTLPAYMPCFNCNSTSSL